MRKYKNYHILLEFPMRQLFTQKVNYTRLTFLKIRHFLPLFLFFFCTRIWPTFQKHILAKILDLFTTLFAKAKYILSESFIKEIVQNDVIWHSVCASYKKSASQNAMYDIFSCLVFLPSHLSTQLARSAQLTLVVRSGSMSSYKKKSNDLA